MESTPDFEKICIAHQQTGVELMEMRPKPAANSNWHSIESRDSGVVEVSEDWLSETPEQIAEAILQEWSRMPDALKQELKPTLVNWLNECDDSLLWTEDAMTIKDQVYVMF